MENELTKLISRFMALTDEESKAFVECIPIRNFTKGTILLSQGQVSRSSYFIIEGCVRKYYIINGEEKTTNFYVEDEAVSSLQSYMQKTPASHYFECVEDCRLAVLSYDKEQELFKRVPRYENLCRNSVENDFGMQQEALANYMTSTPEDRYKNLLDNRLDLINRIPQYVLASYLGVKPESLSRIRKRIASK
ncbi:Crp/Fnr family transcriptional regulator [Marivirga arenosa]|uniref:Crp/Fnr family transcriptional regulator n=1 Tax=Marivirga arenosa TaxID=3059076 RepID=A0AA49GE56_9BACT|nr:Crp/Fnr family transcriptional regulator [Marivirga sp. BKB1-2]WKK81041.2 Crp/Fnr family transcriptional regulator [Marivirga sp. BKB1-2]